MYKKLLLSVLMLGLCITNQTRAEEAVESSMSNETKAFITIAVLLSPYFYKYWTKEAPQNRFDSKKMIQSLKTILKPGKITESTKELLTQIYYFWVDRFNGTPEVNETTKLKGENHKAITIEVKPKRPATGFIGTLHSKHKDTFTIAGFLATIWALLHHKTVLGSYAELLKAALDSKNGINATAKHLGNIA